MATLTLLSQKGGVGKTTIAVNLSYSLARRGWRVLLVDADWQGGVGFSLTEKSKNAVGYYDFLTSDWHHDENPIREAIISTKLPCLALLTRGSREALDAVLAGQAGDWSSCERIRSLDQVLRSLDYDIVIYDTPTGITEVTLAISRVSDSLLIPEQPTPLCLRSLPQVLRAVAAIKAREGEGGGPRLSGFLLSMTDLDDPSNLDDQREFRDLLPVELVFETVIPRHQDFLEASRRGVPVAMLRGRPSASALIFDQLAAELEGRVHLFNEDDSTTTDNEDYARLVD